MTTYIFARTLPANENEFAGTVLENKNEFAGTIPANRNEFAGTILENEIQFTLFDRNFKAPTYMKKYSKRKKMLTKNCCIPHYSGFPFISHLWLV